MLLETDDQKTTTRDDPQALIEEARQRQRQRAQRRNVILSVTALLVIVGLGVGKLTQGGGAVQGSPPTAGADQTRTVTYGKIVEQKIVPHVPVETRTIEGWYTQGTSREVVTISGGRRFEIGHVRVRDKVLGPVQVSYVYDPSTKTIYRTGYILDPSVRPPTPEQFFRQQVLGAPGAHLAGSRTYEGRLVYVVKSALPDLTTTTYVDKRTYQVLLGVGVSRYLRTVQRGLAYTTLPATNANLALASLSATHPQARTVLQAPPRINQLYGEAAYFSGTHG